MNDYTNYFIFYKSLVVFVVIIIFIFIVADTFEGLIRIVQIETNERILIKGFSNVIEDLSFAHLYEIIMLACIDQSGTTFVYVIKEENCATPKLRIFPVFQINGVCNFFLYIYMTAML